jgi:hypothetical protein
LDVSKRKIELKKAQFTACHFDLLTTDRAEKLPFDWRHLPIIRYEKSKKGLDVLREELLSRLQQESRQQG